MDHWLALSLVALLFWGITGNTQKLATNHISAQFSFLGFAAAFLPIAILVAALFPLETSWSAEVLLLGLAGGVLNAFGALTSFAAFEAGAKSSVAVPIMYLYPLITVVLAHFVLGEQIGPAHWVGILLAPIAAWLLSTD
jgi:transporter family protein